MITSIHTCESDRKNFHGRIQDRVISQAWFLSDLSFVVLHFLISNSSGVARMRSEVSIGRRNKSAPKQRVGSDTFRDSFIVGSQSSFDSSWQSWTISCPGQRSEAVDGFVFFVDTTRQSLQHPREIIFDYLLSLHNLYHYAIAPPQKRPPLRTSNVTKRAAQLMTTA